MTSDTKAIIWRMSFITSISQWAENPFLLEKSDTKMSDYIDSIEE